MHRYEKIHRIFTKICKNIKYFSEECIGSCGTAFVKMSLAVDAAYLVSHSKNIKICDSYPSICFGVDVCRVEASQSRQTNHSASRSRSRSRDKHSSNEDKRKHAENDAIRIKNQTIVKELSTKRPEHKSGKTIIFCAYYTTSL